MSQNYEQFRVDGKKMVDYICEYNKTLHERPVAPIVEPGFLHSQLPKHMPDKAESYETVMQDVDNKIMPGIVHWNHPSFFAYFGSGNSYPSILGDMLSSAIAAVGFSWVS